MDHSEPLEKSQDLTCTNSPAPLDAATFLEGISEEAQAVYVGLEKHGKAAGEPKKEIRPSQ